MVSGKSAKKTSVESAMLAFRALISEDIKHGINLGKISVERVYPTKSGKVGYVILDLHGERLYGSDIEYLREQYGLRVVCIGGNYANFQSYASQMETHARIEKERKERR